MARPKDEDKRQAIIAAAARVVVSRGLGAPTALIARAAGAANGSLFTYFETKSDLFNQLYLELKQGMASAALEGFPAGAELREQMLQVWSNWMNWAVANPEKRSTLAQLGVSDEITPASRAAGHATMSGIAGLIERCLVNCSMRKVSMTFVTSILNSLAEATMDFMIREPEYADEHCRVGFDALWGFIT